ncbi:MAG: hypothetical protein C5B59_03770 [Bacteroidetes bacterium]|nr:MAG: hypothetical protein C5B59_03770 [Bacteroidota bacterium]
MTNVHRVGQWSAMLSFIFALAYSVPQIFSELKWIPHPQDLFWLFAPSLLLAPAFMVTMICLHYGANEDEKIWTAIGVAFAILYCADVTLVYFSQLSVVLPRLIRSEINEDYVLAFRAKTFLMAIDCLGYFFMSFSTFFAAFAFIQSDKWLFRSLLFNGLLMPILVLAFFFPVLYYVGAIWMITFPLAMIQAWRLFRKDHLLHFHLNIEL